MKGNFQLNRSQSCPEFTFDSYKSPIPRRKRALSEHFFNEDEYAKEVNPRTLQVQSRHSETNLMRIDKEKTFMQQNVFDNTGELLAQVVFALRNVEEPSIAAPVIGGGINLFSDESILEDEWSLITTPSDLKPMKNLRKRAKSLHPQISKISNSIETNTPQFTWSGNNNDIQDYINAQMKKSTEKVSTNSKKDNNGIVINIDKVKEAEPNTSRRKSILTAFNNVFRRRNTAAAPNVEAPVEEAETETETETETPKLMVKATLPSTLKRTASMKVDGSRKPDYVRRPSILSNQSSCSEQLLENTTIADLIRAIESAHVKNMVGPMGLENLTNRRISLVAQSARRASVSFSTPLETPPSAGSNRLNVPKPSIAMPRNRIMTMRQNSGPNRFSVTPVLDSPSSIASLSPMIQRRMRRFSAVPPALSTSLQATPLAIRRTTFKQKISPLAIPPDQKPMSAPSKNPNASIALLSKTLSKTLDQPENE